MIPHEYIEELTRRTDIVELVGSYVQLKRKGRLYGGLCPFHSEKTPSFYVYPDTQSFYCFGCQAAGDAISFVKKINNISSGEAIKMLASRAGMPEPQEDDKTGRLRSRVLSMNKEAARFFHACLNSTVEEARQARAYWRRRGLDDKTIVRFGLGYAPNDGQALYQYLRDKGYNQQELDASGLFKRSQSGRIYCLFWKRVMTPIFDLRGNIIAFGGRVMDDSKPKYVNSPETLVYHKSETVFAMQIAKRSASRRFVLCEGYMDVISMQQAGIDTAVCACGTALTPGQVRIISEYADEVILSYDSDEAGQKATLRSLELFRNSPVKVGVLQIPGAKDPDEYIKKYGPERFQALLDGVGNALDFRLKRLRDQYDLSQDAQRLQYVKEAVEMLAERSNPTEQEVYAGRLAEETNISKTAILAQLGTAAKRAGGKYRREKNRELLRSGEMDADVILIFITNMAQYAIRGYSVGALDYVLKPVPYFAFSEQLKKAEKNLARRASHYLMVPVESGLRRLDSSRLYYLESEGHRVHYYTEDGDFSAPGTLKAVEEKLAGRPFARCNSGYLVNLAQVQAVQQNTVQVGPYELQISRPKRKAFLAALTDYIGGEGS